MDTNHSQQTVQLLTDVYGSLPSRLTVASLLRHAPLYNKFHKLLSYDWFTVINGLLEWLSLSIHSAFCGLHCSNWLDVRKQIWPEKFHSSDSTLSFWDQQTNQSKPWNAQVSDVVHKQNCYQSIACILVSQLPMENSSHGHIKIFQQILFKILS